LSPYFPILLFLLFGIVFGAVMSAVSHFFGTKKFFQEKFSNYECGVPSVTSERERMSVKFYLTAILFILFDIETFFLYLWAVVFDNLGWFGLIEVIVFVFVLSVGYFYVLKTGVLKWSS